LCKEGEREKPVLATGQGWGNGEEDSKVDLRKVKLENP